MSSHNRDEQGRWLTGVSGSGGRPAGVKENQPRKKTQVSIEGVKPEDFMRVDRRTVEGRFVTTRAAQHELQLGRTASPREHSLIRRLTMLELQAEIMEERMLCNEDPMPEIYLRIVDRVDRLSKALGLRPQGREVRPLAEIVAEATEKPQEPSQAREMGQLTPQLFNGSSGRIGDDDA